MKIIPVLCQRCGAPLDVADESVRFVTCAHCNTPLEIVREATQSHSRIIEEIHAATTESAKTLKVIELQNDLERLDRDWSKQRAELIHSREQNSGPDLLGLTLGLLFAAGVFGTVGGICMVVSNLYFHLYDGAIQGAGVLVVSALLTFLLRGRASVEDDMHNHLIAAENDHQIRRHSLLNRIEEAKRAL